MSDLNTSALDAYNASVSDPARMFREVTRLREKARHDEAQALWNAEQRGAEAEREKWQCVLADKDALIAALQAKLEERP